MGACALTKQKEDEPLNLHKYKVDDDDLPQCPEGLITATRSHHRMSMVERRNEFVRIDKLLNSYYRQFGVNEYLNQNGNGRFLQYMIEHKLMDIDLSDHSGLNHSSYIHFDPKFPLSNETLIYIKNNNLNRKHAVFYVIQYCFKFDAPPSPNRCMYSS